MKLEVSLFIFKSLSDFIKPNNIRLIYQNRYTLTGRKGRNLKKTVIFF